VRQDRKTTTKYHLKKSAEMLVGFKKVDPEFSAILARFLKMAK